jgi:hypothetical protein
MAISSGANVEMLGTIDCVANNTNILRAAVIITDTSTFSFNGDLYKGRLVASGTSVSTIVADKIGSDNTYQNQCILATENAVIDIAIRNEHIIVDNSTALEIDASITRADLALIYDSVVFTLRGHLSGPVIIISASATVNLYNVTAVKGRVWIAADTSTLGGHEGQPNSTKILIDNCNLYFDFDDNHSGHHIVEDYVGCEVKILDSVLEFSGYSGLRHSYGQPISQHGDTGLLYIRRSQIIQHANQSSGYLNTISGQSSIDLDDTVISIINWSGIDAYRNLVVSRWNGGDIKIKLNNVIFNNLTGWNAIGLYVTPGVTDDDYICATNLVNNTGLPISDDMTSYNHLLTHCPN